MAKPGFYLHPKFKRLVRVLGIPAPYAAGLLEFLWASAYTRATPIVGTAEDVENVAEWPGKAGELASALERCRLIDRTENGDYKIHDLFDHAPEYVVKRARRGASGAPDRQCEVCGERIASEDSRARFCSGACRKAASRRRGPHERAASVEVEAIPESARESGAEPVEVDATETNIVQTSHRCHGSHRASQFVTDVTDVLTQPVTTQPVTEEESASPAAVTPEEFLATWNASGLAKAKKMTDDRRRSLRVRLRDRDWSETWREALERAAKSSFLRGDVGRGWRADIDWFLGPKSVLNILEGKYDDRDSPATAPGSSQETRGGVKPGQDPAEMIESAFANLEAKFRRGKK